jgi:hypothetical protein
VDVRTPRIVIRDAADANVIRCALALYFEKRAQEYRRAAEATTDRDRQLELTTQMVTDSEYVCALLRAVGDGTMVVPTEAGSDTDSEDSGSDE